MPPRESAAPARPLRVLALSSQYPNPAYPHWCAFNRQQLTALAGLCRLSLVAPVSFTWALKKGRLRFPDQAVPYPVRRPLFWFPPRVLPQWQGRFFLRSAWPSLKKAARELGPRVLLATWLHPDSWAGLTAARRLGIPLAVKLHGSDLLVFRRDPRRLPYLRQVLTQAGAVFPVSRELARVAAEMGADPGRIHLVVNGLNRERFHPRDKAAARRELDLPDAGPLALFLGRLLPVKGPGFALEALARVPGLRLIMAGDGALKAELTAQAAALGVTGRVIWIGEVPHSRVPLLMAAADCLVMPSLSEGDPNVAIEALGCGQPVAASAVGGAVDLLSDGRGGRLAPPGDAPALAAALTDILARNWDPEDVAQVVAGRTWEASAARILEVLTSLAGEGA